MINITGYPTSNDDILDMENDISVNNCGHYKLIKLRHFETVRETGRNDYQMLYVAKGKGTFFIDNVEYIISEGNIVIYFPKDAQKYSYSLIDTPELYWVHFTGTDAKELLNTLGFQKSGFFNVGMKNEYIFIFDKIIEELQLKRKGFFELSSLYIKELLTLMSRQIAESENNVQLLTIEVQKSVQYFNQKYNAEISIKDYAKDCGMSVSWFIRNFKEHMGTTPQKYITNIRINKAKDLLHETALNVSEIASLVGYQNPLYFSRIFKKMTGICPLEYKKFK